MYNRHSIRLPNYNYSSKGFYFITICTKNKQHLLSHISSKGEIKLTPIGNIIDLYLQEIHYYIKINQYVIMPNHIHLIIELYTDKINLGKFIKAFKSKISRQCSKLYMFNKNNLWQRNYYEHIIRNNAELIQIKNYIKNNPYKWIYKN